MSLPLVPIVHGELQGLARGGLRQGHVHDLHGAGGPRPHAPVAHVLDVRLVVDVDLLVRVARVVAESPQVVARPAQRGAQQLIGHQSLEGAILAAHLQQEGRSRRGAAQVGGKRGARGGTGRLAVGRGRQPPPEHRRLVRGLGGGGGGGLFQQVHPLVASPFRPSVGKPNLVTMDELVKRD